MSTRICLSFDESPSGYSNKNLWFLFDKSTCRVVADLEYLIRKKFDINALCNLHLNGFLLPSKEKIELVRDGDNLRIQKLPNSIRKESRALDKSYVAEGLQDDQPSAKKKKVDHNKSETEDINPSKQQRKVDKQKQKDKKLAKLSNSGSAKTNGSVQGKSTKDLLTKQGNKTTKKKNTKSTLLPSRAKMPSVEKKCEKGKHKTQKPLPKTNKTRNKTRKELNNVKISKPSSVVPLSKLCVLKSSSSSEESASLSSSSETSSNNQTPSKRPEKNQANATQMPSTSLSNVKNVSSLSLRSSSSSSTHVSCSTETCSTVMQQNEKLPTITTMHVSSPLFTSIESSNTASNTAVGMPEQNRNGNHIHFDSGEDESSDNHHQFYASVNYNYNVSCDTSSYTNAGGLTGHSTNNGTAPHVDNIASTLTNDYQKDDAEYPNVCNSNGTTVKLTTNQEEPQKKDAVDYTTLTPLLGPPRAGDRVAYKVLEISASYTPEMSDYKEGVVLEYNPASNEVLVELNEESLAKPRGDGNVSNKFELISGDEDEDDPDGPTKPPPVLERKVAVCWSSVVDPRLMST